MLKSPEFVPSNREEATLIRLTVADLGFTQNVIDPIITRGATFDRIYERAQKLGLELCPPDTGPHYRLKYQNQPLGEWLYIGMKQIAGHDGYPAVFSLERHVAGPWLSRIRELPGRTRPQDYEYVFRFRPPAERAGKSES